MSKTVNPMKYHQPGWNLDVNETDGGHTVETSYLVWAPQTQEDVDRMGSSNPPRDHWAACIQVGWVDSDDEYNDLPGGGFWKGESFDAVTQSFPANIRRAFKKAVQR